MSLPITAQLDLSSSGTANDYDFDAENQAIQDIYRGSHMVKAGVEWRVGEAVRSQNRCGLSSKPISLMVPRSIPLKFCTPVELGWRKDSFSIDVSLAYQDRDESYYLYDPSVVSETKLDKTKWIGMVSIGFRY
jgi:hypothetical protein